METSVGLSCGVAAEDLHAALTAFPLGCEPAGGHLPPHTEVMSIADGESDSMVKNVEPYLVDQFTEEMSARKARPRD